MEPPNLNLQWFNYTNFSPFLLKNSLYFTPWLVHLYVKKDLGNIFHSSFDLMFMWMWKPTTDWQTDYNSLIRERLFCFFFLGFFTDNKSFYQPWGRHLINLAILVFTKFEIYKNLTFDGHCIRNFVKPSISKFAIIELYYFKTKL